MLEQPRPRRVNSLRRFAGGLWRRIDDFGNLQTLDEIARFLGFSPLGLIGTALSTVTIGAAGVIAALSSGLFVLYTPAVFVLSAAVGGLTAGLVLRFTIGGRAVPPAVQQPDSPFVVRPVPGSGFAQLRGDLTVARLAIRNVGPTLPRCSVRLERMFTIMRGGHLLPVQDLPPLLLEWSQRETAREGNHGEFLTLRNDQRDHIVDVAGVDPRVQNAFVLWTTDLRDRCLFGPGWYRLELTIASESDTPRTTPIDLLLCYHPRTGSVPAPLQLRAWQEGLEGRLEFA